MSKQCIECEDYDDCPNEPYADDEACEKFRETEPTEMVNKKNKKQ